MTLILINIYTYHVMIKSNTTKCTSMKLNNRNDKLINVVKWYDLSIRQINIMPPNLKKIILSLNFLYFVLLYNIVQLDYIICKVQFITFNVDITNYGSTDSFSLFRFFHSSKQNKTWNDVNFTIHLCALRPRKKISNSTLDT